MKTMHKISSKIVFIVHNTFMRSSFFPTEIKMPYNPNLMFQFTPKQNILNVYQTFETHFSHLFKKKYDRINFIVFYLNLIIYFFLPDLNTSYVHMKQKKNRFLRC